ncbi:hypothetical protein ACPA9J_33895 [Pseudomonas aeruginosa]
MTDTPDDRTGDASGLSKRQAFHRQHRQRAEEEARRLLDARAEQGGRWLDWVAGQLYLLPSAGNARPWCVANCSA